MTAKWCFRCGYQVVRELPEGEQAPRNAAIHWRACERKRDWPAWMLVPKLATYAVGESITHATLTAQVPLEDPPTVERHSFAVCECALFSAETTKTRAWVAHRRGAPHMRVMAEREAATTTMTSEHVEVVEYEPAVLQDALNAVVSRG